MPLLLLLLDEFRDAANAVDIDPCDLPDLMLAYTGKCKLHDDEVL